PYLAFAGPATVLTALLNAQGRFALTAFSPLLFNLTLIAATSVLLFRETDAADAALAIAAAVGIAGLLQLLTLVMRRGEAFASPLRAAFDAEMRGFFAKAIPGMIASAGPQLLVVAVGGVVAVFRQSPDRTAARHRRRGHEHRAGSRADPHAARRRSDLDDRSRLARARARSWACLAGGAGIDRAPRTDRARTVPARCVHRRRYRGHRAGPDVAGARLARSCAGQGAVAGILRARGYAHAVACNADGICGRDRLRVAVRPAVWHRGDRCRHCTRRLEQRGRLDPARRPGVRICRRCRGAPAAA